MDGCLFVDDKAAKMAHLITHQRSSKIDRP
jgi:hypothetical protein